MHKQPTSGRFRLGVCVAGISASIACAQSAAAPDRLNREQLLACVELEDAVQTSGKLHEARVAQHNSEATAIQAEGKSIEESQKVAKGSDNLTEEAMSRRIDVFNKRLAAFNSSMEKLTVDEALMHAEVTRYNEACTDREHDVRDRQLAVATYQARKQASAAAGPFEAGLKAFDQGNYPEALKHWLPLAEQGRASAQYNIAVMYEQGLGVNKDDTQSARWFVAAAERGDATSQLKVGTLYEAGQGVAKDVASASYWYGQAANSSDAKNADAARQARERLHNLPKEFQAGLQDVVAFDGGRFVLRRAVNKECVVALQGEVTQSANLKFNDVVKKAKAQDCARPLILLLESPGGSVDAGLALARSVREEGMRTIARYECASSCANIFLGGTERVLWGSRAAIGLHQISNVRGVGSFGTTTCVASRDDPAVQALRRHLRFVVPETSDEIMRIVMNTPCSDIEWVKGKRALDLQLATRIEAQGEDVFGPREERVGTTDTPPR